MWQRRNWWVFMVTVVVFVGLTACLPEPEPQRLEYVGRVIDAETLRPVRDAQASFSFVGAPPVEYTDSNGVYAFLVPIESEPVRGKITILADGYDPFVLNVSLRKDTLTIQDVRLTLLPTSETTLPTEVVEVVEANPQPEADALDTPEVAEPVVTATLEPPTATPEPTATATATPTTHPTSTPTATPNPNEPPANAELGDSWMRPKDNMTMRFVPGGTFPMGSEDWEDDESPVYDVTLNPFWIDQTEVTNLQYAECVLDRQCEQSEYAMDTDFNGWHQPVVGVRWEDAEAYCAWVEARLPTEAEWEYAARGEEGNTYPWGEAEPTCSLANFSPDRNGCVGKSANVGSYSPDGDSWVGAQDMAGNVWEWVNDTYYERYYSDPADAPLLDHSDYLKKVVRGGGWGNVPTDLRSTNRLGLKAFPPAISCFDPPLFPPYRSSSLGFRCAHPSP